jgi:hypothetical protein
MIIRSKSKRKFLLYSDGQVYEFICAWHFYGDLGSMTKQDRIKWLEGL